MQSASSMSRNFYLWGLLTQTKDVLVKVRKRELHAQGISVIKSAIIFIIKAIGDQATPAEISRWILREPHSVSGILSRMEKEGLLEKVKDLDKRNMVRITLTEKGELAHRRSLNREAIERVLSCLSDDECQQLGPILEKLRLRAYTELGIDSRPIIPQSTLSTVL